MNEKCVEISWNDFANRRPHNKDSFRKSLSHLESLQKHHFWLRRFHVAWMHHPFTILIHRLQDSWIPVVSPVVKIDYRNIIPVVKTNHYRNPNLRAETLYMFWLIWDKWFTSSIWNVKSLEILQIFDKIGFRLHEKKIDYRNNF